MPCSGAYIQGCLAPTCSADKWRQHLDIPWHPAGEATVSPCPQHPFHGGETFFVPAHSAPLPRKRQSHLQAHHYHPYFLESLRGDLHTTSQHSHVNTRSKLFNIHPKEAAHPVSCLNTLHMSRHCDSILDWDCLTQHLEWDSSISLLHFLPCACISGSYPFCSLTLASYSQRIPWVGADKLLGCTRTACWLP